MNDAGETVSRTIEIATIIPGADQADETDDASDGVGGGGISSANGQSETESE